ncbi:MAG: translation initiation factor IF-5A [Nanoarchaeota archaeon]|nr:translation initiation factor IF-5A [Nanoarchaeota archaeon]MBU1103675.1 translation initiation factor IF-5A [Nanoarchaeota archaeon]
MVLKIINATEARSGTIILVDGEAYAVRSNDISKTGKHGHAKCRMEAIGVFEGKKKVITVPGHERFDVPNVDKKRAQVLNVSDDSVSVMDLESYETTDVPFQEDLKEQLEAEKQVEVWNIEGKKKVMRVL